MLAGENPTTLELLTGVNLMKQTPAEICKASEPLMQQAIEALRRYHEAKATGVPAGELERLHLLADSLFQAVSTYQLLAFRGAYDPGPRLH